MAFFKLNDDSLLVSLDIGSYAVRCSVFKKSDQIPFKLLAFTEEKTQGLEESRITDFESLSLVFSEVLSRAEELCSSSFSEVWLGFSPPFYSFRSKGMVALSSKVVTKEDLDLAVHTACAVSLPYQHRHLHSRPEAFSVDSQSEVLNPLGLSGLRLETEVRLISAPNLYCKNLNRVLKNLGYKPKAFFHNLLAFGENLTTFEQKKNGVCFCDIGHKSARGLVYLNNKIEDMFFIPIGAYHLSQFLSSQFNLSFELAEDLKNSSAELLFNAYIQEEEPLETPQANLYISRKAFSDSLEKISEKLLEEVKLKLAPKDLLNKISSGFIFTGATAYIKGFIELAEFYLGRPACHPQQFYNNFKVTNNFALLQQAYVENKLYHSKQNSLSKWSILRELF
ncbi:MAG: cell division protein FtsA [Oligoflexia bacterium]|nr:cell division protein FtsA [Oligoflexia bacterium]